MMRTSIALLSSWKRVITGSLPVNSGISPKVNKSVGFTREFSRCSIFWLSPFRIEM